VISHTVKFLDHREGLNIYDEVEPHRIPSGHTKVDELSALASAKGTSWYCDRQALFKWGSRYGLLYIGHGVYVDDFMKMDNYYRFDVVDPSGNVRPEWADFCLPWFVLPVRKETMRGEDYRVHTLNLMAVALAMLPEFPADGEVRLLIKKVDKRWVCP
jgi:hypothetical protein